MGELREGGVGREGEEMEEEGPKTPRGTCIEKKEVTVQGLRHGKREEGERGSREKEGKGAREEGEGSMFQQNWKSGSGAQKGDEGMEIATFGGNWHGYGVQLRSVTHAWLGFGV